MKLLCIVLTLTLLFPGCYSYTPVTKDDVPNSDDKVITFYLTDGTYIKSKAGNHHRIENGYEITGEHVSKKYHNSSKGVSVVLRDDQISRVETGELDVVKTVVVLGLAGLLVAGLIVGLNAVSDAKSEARGI